jgi:exodeoxyribonuclease VII large subunit
LRRVSGLGKLESDIGMSNGRQKNVSTVSALTRKIQYNLNRDFGSVWVSGEISGMTQPSSGHVYLTLKDEHAQLKAIIWQSSMQRLPFEISNGLEVECSGNIDVYPQRGTYQLIVRTLRPKGIGSLELARQQLESKLRAEGLFAPEHKRPLPRFPKHVAVVTSLTGAAIRDFLQVLTRRWPNIRVTIVPVKVQGPGSAREIATGVSLANHFVDKPDVIVVTRGGGSVEDLWSFNEEVVVRSIYASSIPVVSGVGHETDVMLSDLVADVRALTPSEAAEKLTPDYAEVSAWLENVRQRLTRSLVGSVQAGYDQVSSLASRTVITQPLEKIRQSAMAVDHLESRLNGAAKSSVSELDHSLKELSARLHSISPLSVLARGYSLTTDKSGKLVMSSDDVQEGDEILTRVHSGVVESVVKQSRKS